MTEERKPIKTLYMDPETGQYRAEQPPAPETPPAAPASEPGAPPFGRFGGASRPHRPFGGAAREGFRSRFSSGYQYSPGPGAAAAPRPAGDVPYETLSKAARSSVLSHKSILVGLMYDITKEIVWRVGYFSRAKKLIIKSAAATYRAFKKYILRVRT